MNNQVFDVQPRRLGAQVVEAISRAEADIQISTAKQYPRVISKCLETARELATVDQETAAACFYHIPRDGKVISGPSVRLAEIVAYSWKNLRVATRVVDEGDKHIVAQAVCHDLENNVALSRDTRVRITKKDGMRYNEDMIANAANSACSKAMRDVIFDVIPLAVIKPVLEAVEKVAAGDEKTLGVSRTAMIAHFEKLGVPKARVLSAIGKRGIDDITLEDIAILRGFATAIKDGEAKIEECFPDPKAPPPGTTKSEQTAAKLKAKAAPAEISVDPIPVNVPDEGPWTTLDAVVNRSSVGQSFDITVHHVENSSYPKGHRFKVSDAGVTATIWTPANGPLTDAIVAADSLRFTGGTVVEEKGERKFVAEKVEAV